MRNTIKVVLFTLFSSPILLGQNQAVPLPDKTALEEVGELSCHVQQEQQKNADGTMTDSWRPWLRAVRPDGTVWSQQAKVFKNQVDATTECQSWNEIASHLRTLHQMKKAHEQRIADIEGKHQKRVEEVDEAFVKQGGLLAAVNERILDLEKQAKLQEIELETLRNQLRILGGLPQIQEMLKLEQLRANKAAKP